MKLTNTRGWDLNRAMRNLDVRHEKFDLKLRGDAAGYSYTEPRKGKTYLAIDKHARVEDVDGKMVPVAQEMVAFHELGHVVLGHTAMSAACSLARRPEIHRAHVPMFEVDAMKVSLQVARRLGIPDDEANYKLVNNYISHFKRKSIHSPLYTPQSGRQIAEAAERIVEAGL